MCIHKNAYSTKERNFSERNFYQLGNSQICGNKLSKKARLGLCKQTVADDET